MTKPINILDKDYTEWIKQLGTRYRRSQIKAAIKVNEEMLRFYWELGRDIVMRNAENKYGSGFMKCLSRDLKAENPDATCFSPTNLHYMKNFYLLYQRYTENPQQLAEKSMRQISPQLWRNLHTIQNVLKMRVLKFFSKLLKNSRNKLWKKLDTICFPFRGDII